MSQAERLELVRQYREMGATQVDFDAEGNVCKVVFPVQLNAAKLGVPKATDDEPPTKVERMTAPTADEARHARYKQILGG